MTDNRSDHLTMYGLVGVAMHLVVLVLIVGSHSVISSGWLITLVAMWLITAGAGLAMWKRTVWIPLLASIVLATAWMIVFFGSR